MKAYKGFDKDLRCDPTGKNPFQYEIGKEYETEDAECCKRGFHACEAPLDVLRYYPPRSRFCEVELCGKISKGNDDTKCAASKIKIVKEIGIPELVIAQNDWVKAHTTEEHTDPKKATAGDRGAATAGYRGAATSKGSADVGENGIACVRGNGVKVRGGLGAVLVIVVEKDRYHSIREWTAIEVDGVKVKANTWYTLADGKLIEVES